jgi:hypothetical protein
MQQQKIRYLTKTQATNKIHNNTSYSRVENFTNV